MRSSILQWRHLFEKIVKLMLTDVILRFVMLSVAKLSIMMLSFGMLSTIRLNVVILSFAQSYFAVRHNAERLFEKFFEKRSFESECKLGFRLSVLMRPMRRI